MWALPLGRREHSAAGPASSARAAHRIRQTLLLVLAVLLTLTSPTSGQRRARPGGCKVVIRPTASPTPNGTTLQIAEVRLYQSQGVTIERSRLNFALSSAAMLDGSVTQDASYCNDGDTSSVVFLPGSNTINTGPGQICHSQGAPDDPSPSLTISYPCGTRLFKVVVSNRQDCCGDKIDDFSLDVVRKTGVVTQTYVFTGGSTRRTFTIPTACAPGVNTNYSDCSRCLPGRGGARCRLCGGKNKWSPGGSLEACRKCPSIAPTASADKSSCVCSTPGLEFTGFDCVPACPGSSTRDPGTGACKCTPGVKDTKECNLCLPGHGGPTCQPCGAGKWSPGGSLEACRKCPSIAPAASADRSSCVCITPGFKFTGVDCIEPCAGAGVRDPVTGDCGTCRVFIRPTASPALDGTVLHLAEVQLFRSSGAQIESSLLTMSLSSTATRNDVVLSAGYCNDGDTSSLHTRSGNVANTGPGQLCHSKPVPQDPSPSLTIGYPCSVVLTRVVISNRQDCCGDMIDRFTLEVIDEAGAMARTFAFTGGGRTPVYIIPTNIPGEGDFFMIQLLKNGLCLDDAGGEPSLYFGDCNSNKRNRVFVYNQGLIRSAFTRSHCIDAGGSNLVLKTCVSGNVNQVWSLKSTPSGMAVELQGRPDTCFEANTGNGARIGKCSIADGNQRFKFLVEVCTVRNCALCAVGSSAECATCLDGFTLSNGQCPPKACPLANCATCQNGSTSVCKTCDAGYINAEGTCGLSTCVTEKSSRYYGGGFGSGHLYDQLQPDYGSIVDNEAVCSQLCREDSRCQKWVFQIVPGACYRLSSNFTGADRNNVKFISGLCGFPAPPPPPPPNCPAGQGVVSGACSQCPGDRFSAGGINAQCQACPAGQVPDFNKRACVADKCEANNITCSAAGECKTPGTCNPSDGSCSPPVNCSGETCYNGSCIDPCSGYAATATGVAPACLRQVWRNVNCTASLGSDASLAATWWSQQTFALVKADMAAHANPLADAWRLDLCYSTNRTLWPAGADPCSGYIASSTGIAPACMRQLYKEVGCTVVAGDDANLTSRWWSTQTFEVINQDMAARTEPDAEAWRLEACYGTNRTMWPDGADTCSGYNASSTGIAPACMRQLYKEVGCTVVAGDDANLVSRWWSTQTFEVINQDMAARTEPDAEAWRLEACYGTNRTLWPDGAGTCSDYNASSTGIAPACMRQLWGEANCTTSLGSDASLATSWWSTQTFETIKQDMAAFANPKAEAWRLDVCYSSNRTLWPAGADTCSGYNASSTGIAPACMRQLYKEVGCTVVAGDDANLTSRWWSTQTFEVINQDMAARTEPDAEAWRLEACYGTNRTLWPDGADTCSGYNSLSTGIASACMRQLWGEVNCTTSSGSDASLATSWWSTQTFEVIKQDMAAYGNPEAEAWRLEACFGPDKTLWPSTSGPGS